MIKALHYLSLLLAIAWAGVLYYLSDQPGIDIPPLFFGQDKLFHATAYGVLGFLVLGALRPVQQVYDRPQLWLAFGLVAGYGVLDEIHQYFVPGRSADVFDVVADAAGGLLGMAVMIFIVSRLSGAARTATD